MKTENDVGNSAESLVVIREIRDRQRRLDEYHMRIAPLVDMLIKLDVPIRMTLDLKSGTVEKEYPEQTPRLMDEINVSIDAIRDHIFRDNKDFAGSTKEIRQEDSL